MSAFEWFYVLMALICWPIFAFVAIYTLAHDLNDGHPETADFVAGTGIGTFAVLIWPLFVVMGIMYVIARRCYATMERIRAEIDETNKWESKKESTP